MCTDLLDCIGISMSWVSEPIAYFLYFCATVAGVFLILFLSLIFVQIKSSCGSKRLVTSLAVLGSTSKASIIVIDTIPIPCYEEVEMNVFPIFDENVLKFAQELVVKIQKPIDLYGKTILEADVIHNCENGILIPFAIGNKSVVSLNNNKRNPFCVVDPNAEFKGAFLRASVLNENELYNYDLVKKLYPSINWQIIDEYHRNDFEWICNSPKLQITFPHTQFRFEIADIQTMMIRNTIEFKDSISECESSNCEVGFKELTEMYNTIGNDIKEFKISSRSKRSMNVIKSNCWSIGVLSLLGVGYKDCEMDVTSITGQIEELQNDLVDVSEELNKKFNFISDAFSNFENVINELSSEQVSIKNFIEKNILDTSSSISVMTLIADMKILKSDQKSELLSIISRSQSMSRQVLESLKEMLMLPVYVKNCVSTSDCSNLNMFLAKRISYWDQLIKHNFNPRTKLINEGGKLSIQFLTPKKVEWKNLLIPIIPEVTINKNCRKLRNDFHLCSKCYHQDLKFLTSNFNGSNNNYMNLTKGSVIIGDIQFENNCLSPSGESDQFIEFNQICLEIADKELTVVKPSKCSGGSDVHAKHITSSYKIPEFSNVLIKQNINFTHELLNFKIMSLKKINQTIKFINMTELINKLTKNSTIKYDKSLLFKIPVQATFDLGLILNLINMICILTIIGISLGKTKHGRILLINIRKFFKSSIKKLFQSKVQNMNDQLRQKEEMFEAEIEMLNRQNNYDRPCANKSKDFMIEIMGVKNGEKYLNIHKIPSSSGRNYTESDSKVIVTDELTGDRILYSEVTSVEVRLCT